ncbi:hypothetical protein MTO96_049380 [Rhipicephalus appendiculatus]
MASAMETEFEPDVRQEQEAQDLQSRLVHIDGRTAIAVQGEILPDDDIAGWETGARQPRQHKPTSHACFNDAASIANTTKYAGRAAKSATGKTYARNQTRRFASPAVSLTQETRTPKNASHVASFVTAPHPTGAPGCSNRFKLPYLVKKRRWENARHTSSTHVSIAVNDNPAEFLPLKADRPLEERKRSASRSCLRGVQGGDSGRATSHGRESRSRSKRRTAQSVRLESRSRERATWSEKVANHHRSKSRTPQIEDTMRALQQDNANLRAENRNLKAQVRELKQGQAEILRLVRAGQQPTGTTRMDIAQAAQRSLNPTPPSQQVPDQRSATPIIGERTPPQRKPPSTAPQHETVEDMEEHTAEVSRPSFKEHRAANRERESTNARLSRQEKRIELVEKRLTALELRVTTGFTETKALLNQILNKNNTTNEENNTCSMAPIPQTWTETPQSAQD